MPIKSAGIVPELLREPSQEWSGGGLAGRIDLPATQRSEADQNSLQPLARK
jgi:hypothetical protein